MIIEDYVTMDIAEGLQKKGFLVQDKIRKAYRKSDGELVNSDGNFDYDNEVPCPTVQMTLQWLFHKYGLFVSVDPDDKGSGGFRNSLYQKVDGRWEPRGINSSQVYDTMDKCALDGIRVMLKHIIPLWCKK
jgi:hypothetical protein